jgi:hypothetical protein
VTPAYFLWGYVTYKVYEICSTDTDDLRQWVWELYKGLARKCCNILQHPIHCDCRSVLNDMVVTYKAS